MVFHFLPLHAMTRLPAGFPAFAQWHHGQLDEPALRGGAKDRGGSARVVVGRRTGAATGAMVAVPIAVNGSALEPGAPVVLFPTSIVDGGVDTQHTLPFGTPRQVREQVLRRCDIFSAGGNADRGAAARSLISCSTSWNDADMLKIGLPCWIATTRRVVKLRPSRIRSTS